MQVCDLSEEIEAHQGIDLDYSVVVMGGDRRLSIACVVGTLNPQEKSVIETEEWAEDLSGTRTGAEELIEKLASDCAPAGEIVLLIDGKEVDIAAVDFEDNRILICAETPESKLKSYTFFGFWQSTDEPWASDGQGASIPAALENALQQYVAAGGSDDFEDLWIVGCVKGSQQEVSGWEAIKCAAGFVNKE